MHKLLASHDAKGGKGNAADRIGQQAARIGNSLAAKRIGIGNDQCDNGKCKQAIAAVDEFIECGFRHRFRREGFIL